jgi:WD40-like Beta Propeller Repeat
VRRWAAAAGLLAAVALLANGSGGRAAVRDSTFSAPVWSTDGARIAWAATVGSSTDPKIQIWEAEAGGTGAHPIGKPLDGVGQLRWLPSGALLADVNFRFVRVSPNGVERTLATATDTTFTTDASGDEAATGSAGCPYCHGPVGVLDLRTRRTTLVGVRDEANSTPGLSPDGTEVAYARGRCAPHGGECDVGLGLWVAPVGGSGAPRRLAASGGCPVWSPDGSEIAYADRATIRVVPASGGPSRVLARQSPCDTSYPPAWSPGGDALALVQGRAQTLRIVDTATDGVVGRSPARIGQVIGFSWSPDGTALVVAARPGTGGACASLWRVTAHGGNTRLIRSCD